MAYFNTDWTLNNSSGSDFSGGGAFGNTAEGTPDQGGGGRRPPAGGRSTFEELLERRSRRTNPVPSDFEQLLQQPIKSSRTPSGPIKGLFDILLEQPVKPAPAPIEPTPSPRPPPSIDLPSVVDGSGGGGGTSFNSLLGRVARSPITRRALGVANIVGPFVDAYSLWNVYLNSVPEPYVPMSERGKRPKRTRTTRSARAPRRVEPSELLGSDAAFMREVRNLRQPRVRPNPSVRERPPAYADFVESLLPRASTQPSRSPTATPTATQPRGFLERLAELVPLLQPLLNPSAQPRRTAAPSPRATPRTRLQPRTTSPRQPSADTRTTTPTGPGASGPTSQFSEPIFEPSESPLPTETNPEGVAPPTGCDTYFKQKRAAKRKACRVIGYETITIKRRKCAKD